MTAITLALALLTVQDDPRDLKRKTLEDLENMLKEGHAKGEFRICFPDPDREVKDGEADRFRALEAREVELKGLLEKEIGEEALKKAQTELDEVTAEKLAMLEKDPRLPQRIRESAQTRLKFAEAKRALEAAIAAMRECLKDELWESGRRAKDPRKVVELELEAAKKIRAAQDALHKAAENFRRGGGILVGFAEAAEAAVEKLEELARRLVEADRGLAAVLGPIRERLARDIEALARRFVETRGKNIVDARVDARREFEEISDAVNQAARAMEQPSGTPEEDIRRFGKVAVDMHAVEEALRKKKEELSKKYGVRFPISSRPDASMAKAVILVEADKPFHAPSKATVWIQDEPERKPVTLKPGETALVAIAGGAALGGTAYYLLRGRDGGAGIDPLLVKRGASLQATPNQPAAFRLPTRSTDVELRTAASVRTLNVVAVDDQGVIAVADELTEMEIAAPDPVFATSGESFPVDLYGLATSFDRQTTSKGATIYLRLKVVGGRKLPDATRVRVDVLLSEGLQFPDFSRETSFETTFGEMEKGAFKEVIPLKSGPQYAEAIMEVLR